MNPFTILLHPASLVRGHSLWDHWRARPHLLWKDTAISQILLESIDNLKPLVSYISRAQLVHCQWLVALE